jgi:hypothetical protein
MDGKIGLRLDQDGVEVLECVQAPEIPEAGKDSLPILDPSHTPPHKQLPMRSGGLLQRGESAPADQNPSWERKGRSAERSLKEVARQCSHFTEDDWEAYESAVAWEAYEQIQQERKECLERQAEYSRMSIVYLDEPLTQRLDAVKQREGTSTIDGTLAVLLDGYEWLHRGGSIPSFLPNGAEAVAVSATGSSPDPYAIRQATEERLVAIDPAKAARGLEKVVERVLDTYEWLMQGGLSKKLFVCLPPDSRGVWMKVDEGMS